MSAPILFENALEAAALAIEQAGVDLTGCEATLLRDLRGKLRLHIKSPAGQSWLKTAKNDLKKALESVEPFGTGVVYLEVPVHAPMRRGVAESRLVRWVVSRGRVLTPDLCARTPRYGEPAA